MALYSHDGFGLNFEINRNYTYIDGVKNSVDYEVYARAVYSLYSAPYTTIRALDGKLIDYSGEEIIPDGFTGEYSDIQGHWAEKEIKKFKVGKKYSMRSACDYDCIWTYQVISRTDSTVVLQKVRNGKPCGEQARFRINRKLSGYYNAEAVRPLGTYSMCPTLTADNN
jgi:hypothetical protein